MINRLQREKNNLNKRIDELKRGERLTAIAKRQTAKDQSRAQVREKRFVVFIFANAVSSPISHT